ncbi:MAG: energy transducer TonB [Myxococcales bacterium]|nr:energy transducer TonB [Myxococcales bacterium]
MQPKVVPTGAPREGDPSAAGADGADPYADADAHGSDEPGAPREPTGPAPPPPTPAPPAPAPRPPPAVKATREDVAPPKPLSRTPPAYPASAKAAGVEGTVTVRYVVTESGDVAEVRATAGPEELRAACVAAVASWRFEPATSEGRPVRFAATARFPFRIRS